MQYLLRMTETAKRGRGRPKGATSTIEMKVSEIVSQVDGDMDAVIQVGRTWLSKRTPVVVTQSPKAQEAQNVNDGPIEFTIS